MPRVFDYKELPLTSIKLNPERERKIDPDKFEKIKASMARDGQLQPILVTTKLELVAGKHRFKAAQELSWDKISCFVCPADTKPDDLVMIELMEMRTGSKP